MKTLILDSDETRIIRSTSLRNLVPWLWNDIAEVCAQVSKDNRGAGVLVLDADGRPARVYSAGKFI